MRYNHVKRGESDALEKWYEHDATVLHPLPFNGLKNETATPWVQGVRFGLSATELEALRNKTNNNNNNKKEYRVTALQEKHLSTEHIPMASVHPLYTAGLLPLETDQENTDIRPLFNNHNNPLARPNANRSRINVPYVLSQQRREMALDEEKFWERVELIRKSQQATTPAVKRPYQGDSSVDGLSTVVKENVEESVQLKFNQ
ncbi:hypothetical protein AGDE_00244 [Angomonas deanei]|nr:hypothetical protein AGDE_00244 [Angomonas deanei]|eukprot:EPY43677.1 hypothetical protein AGDE_00244 [Angomonas deanei]